MTTEASLLARAIGVVREHDPDPALLDLLARLLRASTVLLFRPAGRDAGGLARWTVGHPEHPCTFAARSDAMRALFLLARDKAAPVELVDGGADGAEAVRLRLKRALRELREHCPDLAAELARFTITDNVVRCTPRARVDVGLALATRAKPRRRAGWAHTLKRFNHGARRHDR